MKKQAFLLLLITLVLQISCKKSDNEDNDIPNQQDLGRVVLYIDGQKIFDHTWDNVNYVSYHGVTGFRLSNNDGIEQLGGGITYVPDVGQSNEIANSNTQECDNTTKSCITIESNTGEYTTPDGKIIRLIVGLSGTVTRPSRKKVEATGRCMIFHDATQADEYDFRLEIIIAHFN